MKKILIVGDTHGNFDSLNRVIEEYRASHDIECVISVGDFGYGPSYFTEDLGFSKHDDIELLFIRGNHEEHDRLPIDEDLDGPVDVEPQYYPWKYVPDGFFYEELGILFIGGAWSIDGPNRKVMNQNYIRAHGQPWAFRWFENTEEIPPEKWEKIIDFVEERGDDIKMVISHDGPEALYGDLCNPSFGKPKGTMTGRSLQRVASRLSNTTFVFGHHHKKMVRFVEESGNRFICLDLIHGYYEPELFEDSCVVVSIGGE